MLLNILANFWLLTWVAVWLRGNALVSINKVTLRRVRLVLGWVTVCGRVNHLGMQNNATSHPGQLSLAIPPWVGAVSTSESWRVNGHTARYTRIRGLAVYSTTRTSATDTTNGQKFATSQHLDMSRRWALALRCGKFVVELL